MTCLPKVAAVGDHDYSFEVVPHTAGGTEDAKVKV